MKFDLRFRLTPRSMTLNCYKHEFLEISRDFADLGSNNGWTYRNVNAVNALFSDVSEWYCVPPLAYIQLKYTVGENGDFQPLYAKTPHKWLGIRPWLPLTINRKSHIVDLLYWFLHQVPSCFTFARFRLHHWLSCFCNRRYNDVIYIRISSDFLYTVLLEILLHTFSLQLLFQCVV